MASIIEGYQYDIFISYFHFNYDNCFFAKQIFNVVPYILGRHRISFSMSSVAFLHDQAGQVVAQLPFFASEEIAGTILEKISIASLSPEGKTK
jgi:hypothetical protein